MASLSLKHIYKVYPNGVKAVNDFNMEIQDKEFIVFVGPSGCGKSTTLRMIAGLEEITAGELRIGDLVVNDVEPKDRDIAMVFQNYALYPHMTVYDNMAFGLKIRKLPREEIDKKVREAAEVLGITEYLDRKPKEMSGGQRQRVALGRAIVREPKVFLLDEPLSNLDAKLRAQMRTEISKLHTKLNTTFIYVTHDQVEAMTMGTRIVVMKDGFIQQIDTPRDLYLYPNNKFVAGFIGTPQMNFLKGTLKRKGEKVEITIKGTEDVLTVAFEHFVKVRPDYLTGEREVVIGVRPDHLSKEEEFIKQNKTSKIKCKVTAIEELGTESQIYGELDLNDDIKLSESETSIVIKSAPGLTLQIGDVIDVAFNLHHIHLFDAETEESILPRIPEYNFIEGKIVGGKLEVCGAQRILPPACKIEDGPISIAVPSNDIIFEGGVLPVTFVKEEKVNGNRLLSLKTENGQMLFAVNNDIDVTQPIKISFDIKEVRFYHGIEEIVKPLPLVNSLEGSFIRKKVKINVEQQDGKVKQQTVAKYDLSVADCQFESRDDISYKLISGGGREIFGKVLRYEFSPYDVKIAEAGICARVEECLDYGKEKFLRCSLTYPTPFGKAKKNESAPVTVSEIYVATDKAVEGEVKLALNADKLSIVEVVRDIRLV